MASPPPERTAGGDNSIGNAQGAVFDVSSGLVMFALSFAPVATSGGRREMLRMAGGMP
jgi:hypothetical protein